MYEHSKEIAQMLEDVRRFLCNLWERETSELQVGDIWLTTYNHNMLWEDMIIARHTDYGSYLLLPPVDDIPPALAGFLHILGTRRMWQRAEMYYIEGHTIDRCDGECMHVKTLANCRTPEMRARMVMEMDECGEEE